MSRSDTTSLAPCPNQYRNFFPYIRNHLLYNGDARSRVSWSSKQPERKEMLVKNPICSGNVLRLKISYQEGHHRSTGSWVATATAGLQVAQLPARDTTRQGRCPPTP
ncbi:hypothetical protein ACFX1Q_017085 [Malus domestica]